MTRPSDSCWLQLSSVCPGVSKQRSWRLQKGAKLSAVPMPPMLFIRFCTYRACGLLNAVKEHETQVEECGMQSFLFTGHEHMQAGNTLLPNLERALPQAQQSAAFFTTVQACKVDRILTVSLSAAIVWSRISTTPLTRPFAARLAD